MIVTVKDLRFNVSMLFDVLGKGEDVFITYRGKAKAKLIPYDEPNGEPKNDEMFGVWRERTESVDEMVRGMRAGRNFEL